MPRASQTLINRLKHAAAEVLQTNGQPMTIDAIMAAVMPQISLAFSASPDSMRLRARRVLERFFFNSLDTRFKWIEKTTFIYNPLGENKTPVICSETCVQITSINGARAVLLAPQAYEFAVIYLKLTRDTPPKERSVQCAVHACLRCNCDGKTWAFGFEWRCVPLQLTSTVPDVIRLFYTSPVAAL